MSDFVRYSPQIETFDPKLAEYMTRIIDFWETKVRESPKTEGTGRAVRGAHAKTIGVTRGRSRDPGRCATALRAGHLRDPRPPRCADPVLQRLQPPGPGREARTRSGLRDQDLRRRRDQAGRRRARLDHVRPRAEEQPDLHRQHREALPVHPGDRRSDSAATWRADSAGFPRTPHRLPHRQGHARAVGLGMGRAIRVRESGDADAGAQPAAHHVLDDGGGAAWRLCRQDPCRSGRGERRAGDPPPPRPQQRTRTCSARPWRTNCKRTTFDFDLQVQLCTDLAAMPVNDTTVEWPEKLSPFVTVGRVHLPRQDISGPENFEKR